MGFRRWVEGSWFEKEGAGRGWGRLCLLGWWNNDKHKSNRDRDIGREGALNEILHLAVKRTGLGPHDAITHEPT